ncbi:MAG: AzlC family ABC transporter permease [Hyphomicrobiales bacterium]|nr:AzlC family ABC transporter permease [Hyphomicrobiales bacterium]
MALLPPAKPMLANPFAAGARRALGAPTAVITASFLGFGALVAQQDFGLLPGLLTTLTIWALPGQIVLVELYGVGASLAAIGLAVALTNARLLPMTVALVPLLRRRRRPGWRVYLAAHWIAVTAWVAGMRDLPQLPRSQRLAYFMGMAMVLWWSTLAATALGFWLAGTVPHALSLALVFINPLYFMLALVADLRDRGRTIALAAGAVLGPVLHLVTPDWGLLVAGLAAGTLGYLLAAHGRRRGPGGG